MRARPSSIRWSLVLPVFLCGALRAGEPESASSPPLGSGDGRIHVIPALSRPSVKNGEKLGITAIVKASAGIRQVQADLGGVETLVLKPAPVQQGGADPGARVGLFSAEWTAPGLKEQVDPVTLPVTDLAGHGSLSFSDPVAGNTTPGTTAYPDGGLRRLNALTFPDESRFISSVIDPMAGYAYFGTAGYPGKVLKVARGAGGAPPVRIGSVTLEADEGDLRSAVIDPAAGYAYFGSTNGHAYFGTETSPDRVVRWPWEARGCPREPAG